MREKIKLIGAALCALAFATSTSHGQLPAGGMPLKITGFVVSNDMADIRWVMPADMHLGEVNLYESASITGGWVKVENMTRTEGVLATRATRSASAEAKFFYLRAEKETVTLDEKEWIVIRKDVVLGGAKYSLIVSVQTLFDSPYLNEGVPGQTLYDHAAYKNLPSTPPAAALPGYANIRMALDAWYANLPPDGDIRPIAVMPANLDTEMPGTPGFYDPIRGYSEPTATMAGIATSGIAFPPSYTEIMDFMASYQQRTSAKAPATLGTYWTRTRHGDWRLGWVGHHNGGFAAGTHVGITSGVRPALWIKTGDVPTP